MPRWMFNARRRQHEDRSWRARHASVGLFATVVVLGMGAEGARAGTYVMRTCDVPGQPAASLGPWIIPQGYTDIKISDNCATGGGVTFELGDAQQLPGGRFATIGLYEPSGPPIQIRLVKAVIWYAARLAASGQPLSFWTAEYHSGGLAYPGLSNGPPGSENLVGDQIFDPDTTEFRVGLGCGPAPGAASEPSCVPAKRVPLMIRGMEVTLSEDAPPDVVPPTGTLVDDGPRSGTHTVPVTASDPQSGIKQIDVLLGGTVVASRDLTPRCSYSDFTACPATVDAALQVDTRAVPNGTYALTVRVLDAAGNERLERGKNRVEVANEQTNPSAVASARGYAIVTNFKGTSSSKLTVPYGRRVSVRGRLTQGSQAVGAGTHVEVLERLDRTGARESVTRTVTTKADGSFSIGLATSRPSRVVRVAYRPAAGGQVLSRALNLRIRAASRVRATLRGRVVRFSGRVVSGPIPKAGKRVQMEGRSPGSTWTVFKTLRTDSQGRFSGTYRLRVRRPGVVLKVRAVVPSESGYGYLGSRSRAVSLRVR